MSMRYAACNECLLRRMIFALWPLTERRGRFARERSSSQFDGFVDEKWELLIFLIFGDFWLSRVILLYIYIYSCIRVITITISNFLFFFVNSINRYNCGANASKRACLATLHFLLCRDSFALGANRCCVRSGRNFLPVVCANCRSM